MADRTDFVKALKFTLAWEGGYSNHPADTGGATNKGITQKTYDAYRKSKNLPVQSVRSLADAEIEDLYFSRYWLTAHCEELPSPLSAAVFDTSVNYGATRAVKFVQQAVGVTQDGSFGPQTRAAIGKFNARTVAVKICDLRIARRHARVKEAPSQAVFLKGWLNRDNALKTLVASLESDVRGGSKITGRQFALHQLSIARGFVGMTRKNNKPQITRFLNLFGLPFANPETGKPYAFCACGCGWAGAKAYCDLHDVTYTAENAVAVFRSVLDEIASLYYLPAARCRDMIADAQKRGTWRTRKQAGEMLSGDIAFFQMDDDPEADHVEFVEFPPEDKTPEDDDEFGTVGFNTTLKVGSQSNGGAVAQKVRTVGELYGWIALR